MDIQQLESNLSLIKTELEREVSPLNMTEVQDKLMKLCTYMGLSSECMKTAKGLVLYGQRNVIEKTKSEKLNPSILKMRIEGELWNELALLTYCDRLNAAIVHSCDSLRTVISLYKAEMQATIQQN